MYDEAKPCPFCGSKVHLVLHEESVDCLNIVVECEGCHMEFRYSQEFYHSGRCRVPANDSFIKVWDKRVDSDYSDGLEPSIRFFED